MSLRIDARRGRSGGVNAGMVTPGRSASVGDLGLSAIGDALNRRRDELEREKEAQRGQDEQLQLARMTSEARRDWAVMGDEMAGAYDGAEPGFHRSVREAIDTDIGARLSRVDPRMADRARANLMHLADQSEIAALNVEGARRNQWRANTALDTVNVNANAIQADPALYFDSVRDLDAIADGLGPELGPRVRDQGRDLFARSYVNGRVRSDPRGFLAEADSGDLDALVPPAVMQAGRNAASTEIDRQRREAEQRDNQRRALAALVQSRLADDHVASIAASGAGVDGFDEAAYGQLLPPAQAERFGQELGAARAVFEAIGDVSDLTPRQQAQRLAALRPEPGTPGFAQAQRTYDLAQRTFQVDARARAEDPAGYVMGADTVQRARADLQAAGEDAPPQAAMAVYDAIWAEQDRLGIPEAQRALLTADQASGLVSMVESAGPGPRAQAMRDVVAALEGYGEYRDVALGQLQAAGLDPMTSVMTQIEDPSAQTRLARAIDAGDASRDAVRARHGATEARGVREAVESRLRPMTNSLLPMNGGTDAANALLDAAEAMALDARARGASRGDAAQQAADALIAGYAFDNGYRIPRALADAQIPVNHAQTRGAERHGAVTPDRVQARPVRGDRLIARGTEMLMTGLTADDGARLLPLEGVEFGAMEAGRRTADAVRRHGRWVTTEDESGLMLMVAPDGVPTPVYFSSAEGEGLRPVMMSWEALAELGAARTTFGLGQAASALDDIIAPIEDMPEGVPYMRPRGRSSAYGWQSLPIIRQRTGNRPDPEAYRND